MTKRTLFDFLQNKIDSFDVDNGDKSSHESKPSINETKLYNQNSLRITIAKDGMNNNVLPTDRYLRFKMFIDCNFDASLFFNLLKTSRDVNGLFRDSAAKSDLDDCLGYCFPYPDTNSFICHSISNQLSKISMNYSVWTWNPKLVPSFVADPFHTLMRRKVEWQESIQNVLDQYLRGDISSFMITDRLFDDYDPTESLPTAYFTRESYNDSKENLKINCIVSGISKLWLAKLEACYISIFQLKSTDEVFAESRYDNNKNLWSSRGISDSISLGITIALEGIVSVRVLVDLYLSSIISKTRRVPSADLPYIVSKSWFRNALPILPRYRPLYSTGLSEDDHASKRYRYELCGIFDAVDIQRFGKYLKEVSKSSSEITTSKFPLTAIDKSWTYKLKEVWANSDKMSRQTESIILEAVNPFVLTTTPCDSYSRLQLPSSTNKRVIEEFEEIDNDALNDDVLGNKLWLNQFVNLNGVKYFSITVPTSQSDVKMISAIKMNVSNEKDFVDPSTIVEVRWCDSDNDPSSIQRLLPRMARNPYLNTMN